MFALYGHRLLRQNRGSRAIDDGRTKQVGRHQAVYVRIQVLGNLEGSRPQWAESRRAHGQNLGRRKRRKPKGTRPRNRGSGGNDCEHRRRQGAHRKQPPVTLWFLSGDTERNPPRRAEPFFIKEIIFVQKQSFPPKPSQKQELSADSGEKPQTNPHPESQGPPACRASAAHEHPRPGSPRPPGR